MNRLIRRTITKWQCWRLRKQSRREYPELRQLDTLEIRYRNSHSRGAAYVQQRKRDLINAALRGG